MFDDVILFSRRVFHCVKSSRQCLMINQFLQNNQFSRKTRRNANSIFRSGMCTMNLAGARVMIVGINGTEVQCGSPIPSTAACATAVARCNGLQGSAVILRGNNKDTLNIVEIQAFTSRGTCNETSTGHVFRHLHNAYPTL